MEAWWDDLEEFGHGSQLMARPGDRAVLVAAGPGTQRALEMTSGLVRMGLDVVVVGGTEMAREDLPHLFTTDDLDARWHPFAACVPLQALTYAEAHARGLDVSVPLFGQAHGPVVRRGPPRMDEAEPDHPGGRIRAHGDHQKGAMSAMTAEVPYAFYLPEDPDNTIVQSALDAVRYLFQVSDRDESGHLRCRSIEQDLDGKLVRYRGRLIEGVRLLRRLDLRLSRPRAFGASARQARTGNGWLLLPGPRALSGVLRRPGSPGEAVPRHRDREVPRQPRGPRWVPRARTHGTSRHPAASSRFLGPGPGESRAMQTDRGANR